MIDLYLPAGTKVAGYPAALADAFASFHAGRYEQADRLCARLAEDGIGGAESFNLWAAVAVQLGQTHRAVERLDRAIALDSGRGEYFHNRGNVLKSLGKTGDAIESYRQALAMAPQAPDRCYALAVALADHGRWDEAAPLFRALIAISPDIPDAYLRLGILGIFQGEKDAAIIATRRAMLCRPDFTDAHTNMAVMLRDEEQTTAARLHFLRALLLRPEDAVLYGNLANLLREQGQFDRQIGMLERALLLQPDNAELHYSLAVGRTFAPADPRLDALEKLSARERALDADAQINLHFALAKAYEDLRQPDRAFQHQLRGNALKRQMISYDENGMLGAFDRIKAAFTPALLQRRMPVGEPSDLPIFVLGMPRSGSSLVEQILASHPRVFGAGELPDLPKLVQGLGREPGPYFPEIVGTMPDEALKSLGSRYVAALRARAPRAGRIVDKLPDNFRLIGLIHLCLPNAKIIHTRRDPIDSCLSIFSKLFSSDIGYAYDLAEIGHYWRGYEDLMAHWRAHLPAGSLLEIDYETLVAGQEAETRRMLEFCGLDWDDRCLQFHRTDRAVRTASAMQVRKPLYSSSVGRWRPGAEAIAPLVDALARGS